MLDSNVDESCDSLVVGSIRGIYMYVENIEAKFI